MSYSSNKIKYIVTIIVSLIIAVIGMGQIIFSISVASSDNIALHQEANILNRYISVIKEDISDKGVSESCLNSINSINASAIDFINNNAINRNVSEDLSNELDNISQKLRNYKELNTPEKESIFNQVEVLQEKVKSESNNGNANLKVGIILLIVGIVGMSGTIFAFNKFRV